MFPHVQSDRTAPQLDPSLPMPIRQASGSMDGCQPTTHKHPPCRGHAAALCCCCSSLCPLSCFQHGPRAKGHQQQSWSSHCCGAALNLCWHLHLLLLNGTMGGLPGAQTEVSVRSIFLIELVCLEVQLTFVMYSYKQIVKIIHASKNGINVIEVFSSISKVF